MPNQQVFFTARQTHLVESNSHAFAVIENVFAIKRLALLVLVCYIKRLALLVCKNEHVKSCLCANEISMFADSGLCLCITQYVAIKQMSGLGTPSERFSVYESGNITQNLTIVRDSHATYRNLPITRANALLVTPT